MVIELRSRVNDNDMVAPHTAMYVLELPVSAVKLRERPDNRRESAGIATIPAGSALFVEGSCSLAGLIDVVWEGAVYALFSVDLESRATLAHLAEEPCTD